MRSSAVKGGPLSVNEQVGRWSELSYRLCWAWALLGPLGIPVAEKLGNRESLSYELVSRPGLASRVGSCVETCPMQF
eukprot:scaffold42157_cov29-Cyclotella_meneghiniana.AAC.2